MENVGYLLLIFLVVQSTFIVLDCSTLWLENGAGHLEKLLQIHRGTFFFLGGVWLAYFAIQALLMAAMPTVERTLAWFSGIMNLADSSLSGPNGVTARGTIFLLVMVTYMVAGFWDYCLHRWMLHGRRFWFLHENHHLPTRVFNGMPGISVRPFVAPTTFLTYFCTTGTILCGVTLLDQLWLLHAYVGYLPGLILSFALIGSASHSCFLRQFRWLHRLMKVLFITTPLEHILHHGAGVQGNYGNFTTLWDRVFGTYLDPLKMSNARLQIGLLYDQDFLGTLTGGRWKIPQPVRERYRLGEFCYFPSQLATQDGGMG